MSKTPIPALADRSQKGLRVALVSFCANVLFAGVKIVTGVMGHSYALIADGVESLLDVFSSLMVLGGLKIGAIPPDDDHPFGHGKAEALSSLAVSLVLLVAALGITYKSIQEILVPHFQPAGFTLIVLVVVIVSKEVLFRLILRAGQNVHSLSLKVDAWHHRSDAMTSLAAFVGITIAIVGGKGFESADDWAALLASVIIACNGLRLFKESVYEIMDAAVPGQVEEEVRKIATDIEGVVAVEKCRLRKSGLGYFVEIHVEVQGEISVSRGHAIAHHVKDALMTSSIGILDAVVHVEPCSKKRGLSYE